MDTIFINSENSKTFDPHRLLVRITQSKVSEKYVALSTLSIYYTKNNKFKISLPSWNEELELPDGSYSVSDIQVFLNTS